jgi:hypothetical protein
MGLTEVKIKARGFTYDREIEDPSGNKTVVRAYATRGQTVEVNDKDLSRGEEYSAFYSEEEDQAREALGGRDVVSMSDDELQAWIEEDSPTVKEVVAAAGSDPESARRLLDAENAASGQDPREGVVKGLNKVTEGDSEE